MITRFSIGEFSKATGIPTKTLRFYHEKKILIPASIDNESGYRFYDHRCFERAMIIKALKQLDFSLNEIAEILDDADTDQDVLEHLESQKEKIREEMKRYQDIITQINGIIAMEKENRQSQDKASQDISLKEGESMLVAGIRMNGRYSDCGPVFGKLGRKLGRHISGKAMCLYYDGEYREEDANFEPCFPIKKEIKVDGIHVQTIPGDKYLSLVHKGSYESLGRSYAKLIEYAHTHELEFVIPSREIYLKGPGMIFKGNPEKYLTEIQMPVA